MSADGSATVFFATPRRVPLDELLEEQATAAAQSARHGATHRGDTAPPIPTEPCPVCPFLTERLQAYRETAYWKAMHRRASEREAKLKLRLAELEAKLCLREQQLFGRSTETSSSATAQPTSSAQTTANAAAP